MPVVHMPQVPEDGGAVSGVTSTDGLPHRPPAEEVPPVVAATRGFTSQARSFLDSLARWPARTALVLGVGLVVWAVVMETALGGLATGEFIASLVVGALLISSELLLRTSEIGVFKEAQSNDVADAKSERELRLFDVKARGGER